MRRRNRRWDPPLPGPCQHVGPSMSESVSDAEKAGEPIAPLVELTPRSPPLTITEAGPCPEPAPAPPILLTRERTLAGTQAGFATLDDDELRVAHLWLVGKSLEGVCNELRLPATTVLKLWQQMRRKLREALQHDD